MVFFGDDILRLCFHQTKYCLEVLEFLGIIKINPLAGQLMKADIAQSCFSEAVFAYHEIVYEDNFRKIKWVELLFNSCVCDFEPVYLEHQNQWQITNPVDLHAISNNGGSLKLPAIH